MLDAPNPDKHEREAERHCPQCGLVLPVNTPIGECPRCLLLGVPDVDLDSAHDPTLKLPFHGPSPAASRVANRSSTWEPPSANTLQEVLPQYQIEALLGRGGMGAVYKGRQISLDRHVAIKILPLEMGKHDATYAQRFKNEARAMAKLNHPGIVAVYDFGESSNGLLYFVMEFIQGTDVAKMIAQQGRLHSEHAMAITAHVCDALGYAHSLGILHRDIKPANIIVGYDGRVKVADFGLAKMTHTGESSMTRSGVIMGTLPYMAPESLILGADVDKRADIYGVGVMLYQMLTGRLPQGMFEMPSLLIKGLDPRYDKIVANALREDRELRYASAEALRLELDGILTQPVIKVEASAKEAPAALDTQARPLRPDGPPQPLQRPQARERTYPPQRRSSSGWGLAAAALVIAAGAGVFMKIRNHEKADTSAAATSVGNPASTPPQPPQASVPPESATAPPSASKTETPAPAIPAFMPAAAQPAAPAADVAASPMPAATAPSRAPGVASGRQPVPTSPSAGLPAELATLDVQFRQLHQERVTKPFETGLEDLNKYYLGSIDRATAAEKSGGRLDGILALEAEQRAVAVASATKTAGSQSASGQSAVPESDDEKTPAGLKSLRSTYRAQFAKLVADRAANLKKLTDPLGERLAMLETVLTKANRVPDAKAVRAYREALTESGGGGSLAISGGPSAPATKASPLTGVAALVTSPDYEWSEPENLGPGVNGSTNEHHPTLSDDGLVIVFNSDRRNLGRGEFFEASRPRLDAPFGPAEAQTDISGGLATGSPFLTGDGLTLFCAIWYGPGSLGGADIYQARRRKRDLPWKSSTNLGETVNSADEEGFAALSPDGLKLLISSNRNGNGKNDLWLSRRKSLQGRFESAERLGDSVNTPDRESIAKWFSDSRSFWFRREQGGGKYEKFVAAIDAEGAVTTQRFEFRVGGILEDVCDFSPDGRTAYFQSQRQGGLGKSDLWQTHLLAKPKAPSTNATKD